MKIRITCVLLWALLGAFVPLGWAQSNLSRIYTVGDGLPSAEVFAFAQDDSGRIWFATRSGMAVYDGQEWAVVPDSAGLPTRMLAIGDDGLVWAAAPHVGLVTAYDSNRPDFPLVERLTIRSEPITTGLAVTGQGRDRVVAIGSGRRGVELIRHDGQKIVGLEQGLPSDRVNGVVPWRGGFAVATDEGLAFLTRDGTVDLSGFRARGEPVTGIAVGPEPAGDDGSAGPVLWLVVENRLLVVADGRARVVAENLALPERRLFPVTIIPDPPVSVYLGVCPALYRLGLVSGSLTGVHVERYVDGRYDSVPFLDRERNLWVRTSSGAGKISSLRFTTYRRRDGLMEDEVTAICEPRPGTVVLGHNNGLTVMSDGDCRKVPLLPPAGRLSADYRVMDLEPDDRGVVWIAGGSRGVGRMGLSSDDVVWFGAEAGVRGRVATVHFDSRGRLWAGGDGLFVRDGVGFSEVDLGLGERCGIRSLSKGPDGGVLVATLRFGLLSVRDGFVERIPRPDDGETANTYTSLVDSSDRLWVGTMAGLLVLEGSRLVFSAGPLPAIDSPVFMIVEDGEGAVWFGTENGVIRWDGVAARRYTANDGLAGRETNRAAGLSSPDGRVWIGTASGVSIYDRELDLPHETPPLVELVGVSVEGRPVGVTDALDLRQADSTIEFQFRGVSLLDEDALTYTFLLEGSGDDWSPALPAGRRSVRFTELHPGRYTFRVKAANAAGVWSAEAVSPPIRVRAALWKQWWFVVGMSCLVVFLVFVVGRTTVRWRYVDRLELEVEQRRRAEDEVRRLNLDLEKRVEERTSELREVNRELEAYSYTVAHDLKGPLNSISMLSELVLFKHSDIPAGATDQIEQMLDEVSRMGALIDSLLELSHVGRTEVQRVRVDVSAAAHDVVADLRLRDPDREVRVEIEPGIEAEGDPELIRVVMTNLLANAWKYTVRSPSALIAVGTEPNEKGHVLFVRDNGAGFDMESSDKIFEPFKRLHSKAEFEGSGIGLATVERIVSRHGGRIWATGEEGVGATFFLSF